MSFSRNLNGRDTPGKSKVPVPVSATAEAGVNEARVGFELAGPFIRFVRKPMWGLGVEAHRPCKDTHTHTRVSLRQERRVRPALWNLVSIRKSTSATRCTGCSRKVDERHAARFDVRAT